MTDTRTTQAGQRRNVLLGILKTIDVTVGIAAIFAGVFALVATPPSILREVQWWPLVWVWATLLLVGGAASACGRLLGIWIMETSGIAAAAFGTMIYLVVISSAIHDELGVVVAASIILVAVLFMARRYIELQLFLAEPTDKAGVIERLARAARLRVDTGARSTAKPRQ